MNSLATIGEEPITVDAFSPQLPKKLTRTADKRFVKSMLKIQIYPIIVNVVDEIWHLLDGHKRLDAVRQGSKNGGTGKIRVQVFFDLTPEEEHSIILITNMDRSENHGAQYAALKHLMKEYQDFEKVAEALNLPVKDLKKMDREWSKVPDWCNIPVVKGEMTPKAAIAVGKAKASIQEKARKQFKEEGKLVVADLKVLEMEHKDTVVKQASPMFKVAGGYDFTKRQSFARMELLEIVNGEGDAREALKKLLG